MRQLKITKSITNRESESLEKYLQEIGKEELLTTEEEVMLAQRIRQGDRKALEKAHHDATTITLWEYITQSNHKDVTYYKGLLLEYTRNLLMLMREDFLEEVEGHDIENKTFE